MRPPEDLIDNVEIVEPPLHDITRKGSFLKRACFSGCLILIIITVLIIVGIYFLIGTGSKTISKLPSYFPTSIPIYDPDNISQITIESDKYKIRKEQLSEAFKKFIDNPLNVKSKNATSTTPDQNIFQKIWQIATTPKESYTNTIIIEWKDIDAEPKFISSYFKNQLQKNDYEFKAENSDDEKPFFEFTKDYISGTFSAQKSSSNKKTDWLNISVTLPYLEDTPVSQNSTTTNINSTQHETTSPSL
jgi:hypothetical protein